MDPLPPASGPRRGVFLTEGPAGSTHAYTIPTTVTLLREGGRSLRFTILAFGGGDVAPNSGFIAGATSATSTTRWTPPPHDAASSPCTLRFAFHGDRLVVTQTGACGFGANVTATGRYRLAPYANRYFTTREAVDRKQGKLRSAQERHSEGTLADAHSFRTSPTFDIGESLTNHEHHVVLMHGGRKSYPLAHPDWQYYATLDFAAATTSG